LIIVINKNLNRIYEWEKNMIEINKEDLLKDSIDYEEYSKNICKLTIEQLREEGLIKCGGCCLKKDKNKKKCNNCGENNRCSK
jgi:hypothetical protein